MKVARFLDTDDNICTGVVAGPGSARLIKGNIFEDYIITDREVRIKRLLSPIHPAAILCIGLNYRMHANETGMDIPKNPVLFMKNPASVTGPDSDIEIPFSCIDPLQVDYEVELCVIIGKAGKNISEDRAMEHVFGYTCANDVSARRWQKHSGGGQWVKGKSFDTFCPVGPVAVTRDEIPDPQNLDLSCRLNGEIMQSGSTSDMIFSVAELISRLSIGMTLLPGTIILTGTPSGVGFTRTPPVYMKPGDLLESEIEAIGTMRNNIVAEK